MRTSLFRNIVSDSSQDNLLGEIILTTPGIFRLLSISITIIVALFIALLFFGSYTNRTSVSGELVPSAGVIRIHSPQAGIILHKFVKEGQSVNKDDILFVLSNEHRATSVDEIQSVISTKLATQRFSLNEELNRTRALQKDEEKAQIEKIIGIRAEISNIAQQMAAQRKRISLAESAFKRAMHLGEEGFLSAEAVQQKQVEALDSQSRLVGLEREQINSMRDLSNLEAELRTMPSRHHNQLGQIERLLAGVEQEWTESEGKRRIVIRATDKGIATAVSVEEGQTVDGTRALLSIVPRGSMLQAQLYAPSRAIGFIQRSQQVLLRYQAFPYQKFGHARGVVASVSLTVLSANEVPASLSRSTNGEPLYRIIVLLERQTLRAYGKEHPLQPGMLVEADILNENRRLYEWALEPLFSLSSRL